MTTTIRELGGSQYRALRSVQSETSAFITSPDIPLIPATPQHYCRQLNQNPVPVIYKNSLPPHYGNHHLDISMSPTIFIQAARQFSASARPSSTNSKVASIGAGALLTSMVTLPFVPPVLASQREKRDGFPLTQAGRASYAPLCCMHK